MDALVMFFIVVGGLLTLDLAATTWGVDSRDSMPDDHRR